MKRGDGAETSHHILVSACKNAARAVEASGGASPGEAERRGSIAEFTAAGVCENIFTKGAAIDVIRHTAAVATGSIPPSVEGLPLMHGVAQITLQAAELSQADKLSEGASNDDVWQVAAIAAFLASAIYRDTLADRSTSQNKEQGGGFLQMRIDLAHAGRASLIAAGRACAFYNSFLRTRSNESLCLLSAIGGRVAGHAYYKACTSNTYRHPSMTAAQVAEVFSMGAVLNAVHALEGGHDVEGVVVAAKAAVAAGEEDLKRKAAAAGWG